jgi:hypothetical protein
MRRLIFAIVAASSLGLAAPASAQDDGFTLTPYIWLPTFEADLRYSAPPDAEGRPHVSVGPVDWLENLNGAALVAADAHWERIGVFGDFMYLALGQDEAVVRSVTGPGPLQIPIDIGSEVDLSGMLVTLGAGYVIFDNDMWRVEPFVAMRYLDVEAELDWSLEGPLDLLPARGSMTQENDNLDFLGGVRGSLRLDRWVFPYYLDYGGGDSLRTWQASVGVGYGFEWGEIRLDYRYLDYEQDEEDFLQQLTLHGPSFGATLRF